MARIEQRFRAEATLVPPTVPPGTPTAHAPSWPYPPSSGRLPRMFQGSYPVLMAEYNHWMNRRMYAACATLKDEERRRDHGLFFKSIHSTLNHLLWGDRAWMRRFTSKAHALGALGQELYADFSQLSAAREELDGEILDFARGVTAQWLEEPLTWTSQLYGFTQTAPRLALVTQMFNHQTHHRGQVHAILTRLGVDMGPTDIPLLPALNDTTAPPSSHV